MLLQVLCAIVCANILPASGDLDYKDQVHWDNRCFGSRQSPINIKDADVITGKKIRISLQNYEIPEAGAILTNNGHTLQVDLDKNSPKRYVTITGDISDSGVNKTYVLAKLHFHWGEGAKDGSEHAVNGKRYALELHMVHINVAYPSVDEALRNSDGLFVMGVIYQEFELHELAIHPENKGMVPFLFSMPYIWGAGSTHKMPQALHLYDLLPQNRDFYFYRGSLTTPSCNEVVLWVVFKNRPKISNMIVMNLHSLAHKVNSSWKAIGPVVRNLQPVNMRKVYLGSNNAFNQVVAG